MSEPKLPRITNEEREVWLKSLKEGDIVAVERHVGYGIAVPQWDKQTVKRITPTGRIKLDDGKDYGEHGTFYSKGGHYNGGLEIIPWNDLINIILIRRKLESNVSFYLDRSNTDSDKISKATDEELFQLFNALRKLKKERKDQ